MYYVVSGFLKGVSFFPLPVLYIFSDLLYFITYYVIGYRKKVVMNNLLIAFPGKTARERKRIAKDFYHGLIDTLIETLKFFSWSYERMEKKVVADYSALEPLYRTGRPIHVIAMHNFNWEFVNWHVARNVRLPFYAIYLPIGNKHIERMLAKSRSRQGTRLIPATEFKSRYGAIRNEPHILGSAADQSPADPRNAWWLDFFGRKTAFIRGAERGAAATRAGVAFVHFYRIKRGKYQIDLRHLCDDASALSPGEMTKAYAAYVEDSVRKRPSNYLWSHRRWKHEWNDSYKEITL
jgi:KDO2-lipid IV(A) lauroyltransferase